MVAMWLLLVLLIQVGAVGEQHPYFLAHLVAIEITQVIVHRYVFGYIATLEVVRIILLS